MLYLFYHSESKTRKQAWGLNPRKKNCKALAHKEIYLRALDWLLRVITELLLWRITLKRGFLPSVKA